MQSLRYVCQRVVVFLKLAPRHQKEANLVNEFSVESGKINSIFRSSGYFNSF